VAVTKKEVVCPAVTVIGDAGWAVIVGRVPTVSVTVLLVIEPAELATLQRNWSPDMASVATTPRDAVVVPV
jgi:hypothetical protein